MEHFLIPEKIDSEEGLWISRLATAEETARPRPESFHRLQAGVKRLESREVGRVSKGWLAKNRDYTHNPGSERNRLFTSISLGNLAFRHQSTDYLTELQERLAGFARRLRV